MRRLFMSGCLGFFSVTHLTSALDSQLKNGKLIVCTDIYTEMC